MAKTHEFVYIMEKPPKKIHLRFCPETIGQYHIAVVLEDGEPIPYDAPTCGVCLEMIKNEPT